jgi:hypothetical protein
MKVRELIEKLQAMPQEYPSCWILRMGCGRCLKLNASGLYTTGRDNHGQGGDSATCLRRARQRRPHREERAMICFMGGIEMGAAEKAVVYCALVIAGFFTIIGVLYKLFGDVGVAIFAFGLVLAAVYCYVKAVE